MILLSILIPVYNAEEYLERCLDSIVTQPLLSENVEIVTINDGSKDSSLNILNKYANRCPQIRVITRDNQGIGATRNELLEQVQGKYFWFVDADDYISANALTVLFSLLLSNQFDMILLGYYWGNGTKGHDVLCGNHEYNSAIEMTVAGIYNNSLWTRIYRTKIIKDNNIHFENYQMGEDFDFIFKCIPYVKRIKTIDNVLYYYIVNPNSAITSTSIEHKIRASEDSLQCIEHNYIALKHYSQNSQELLRLPLNNFLMGYLYSIYVVPFKVSYKLYAMERLRKMGAFPIRPLPQDVNKKLFSAILNNRLLRVLSIYVDVIFLRVKELLINKRN